MTVPMAQILFVPNGLNHAKEKKYFLSILQKAALHTTRGKFTDSDVHLMHHAIQCCLLAESPPLKGLMTTKAGPAQRVRNAKKKPGKDGTVAPASPIVKLQAMAGSVS
jgi:hypothetical protein